jgi:dTDP-4-dehydrorhamnose reductase
VFSTRVLAYQAKFENERRWLTWDLLCGKVDAAHPMWRLLVRWGARPAELEWFVQNPCPPDVIGINHYVTSNRFLDDRVDLFPPEFRGGNGRHDYADVEAVRMLREPGPSWSELLTAAWERYRLPVAITEVHLGCTRDEQMRWLYQCWQAAHEARAAGCDVRAVTPWALFGSHDWASLLTRFDGLYEPGAWDVRAPTPRATALAGLIGDLAEGKTPQSDSWLRLPGWWQRDSRLLHSPRRRRAATTALESASVLQAPQESRSHGTARLTLITGASGTLGRAFARACEQRGLPHRLVSRQEMDIGDAGSVQAMLDVVRPIAVINTAGYVRVDDAEHDRERCERENLHGAVQLARTCAELDIPLVTFSSDLVFDGTASRPYVEEDPPEPLCVYGAAKARAERAVLDLHPGAMVIRTSAFFGPWDRYNFLTQSLDALRRGETVQAADDVQISPTYVPDLTHAALDLLLDRERGLWHLANRGSTSWYEFARAGCEEARVPSEGLVPVSSTELGWRAARPRYSVLGTTRGHVMPTLEVAIGRFVRESGLDQSLRVAA